MRTTLLLAAAVSGALICSFRGTSAETANQSVSAADKTADAQNRPPGIEKRIPWTTSRITGSPEPPPPYRIERLFPKLQFKNPVDFAVAPGSERLFVMELEGKLFSFPNDPACEKPDTFFDMKTGIPGMTRCYGLTFHPDFKENRFVYISYILQPDQPKGTRVSRFEVTRTDPPRCDPKSEKILIEWRSGGHNGGCLKFGPDGYLYITTGDAAPPSPPDGRTTGQDVSDLLASILRIDVDRHDPGKSYRVPKDNPFVDLQGARPELWAFGFRNPWKMSFNPFNGDMWVGDVGWELWELVYRVERGGNYGWSIVEGKQPVRTDIALGPVPISPPVIEHSHTESRSVTGGYVYRGNRLKDLHGAYVYGDYVTGKIWGLKFDGKQITWQQELVDTPLQIITFGEDHAGELYVLGYGGTINRLVPNPTTAANRNFPKKLSETGLFRSAKKHRPAKGVLPYSVSAQPWEDGATAERLFAIPGTGKLGVHTENNAQVGNLKSEWKYPTDSVLAKTISLEMETGNPNSRRRIETQILHRDGDTWRAYTYKWNGRQSDASLVDASGADQTYAIRDSTAPGGSRKQTWHFAARTECIICHTTRAGTIHGFKPSMLNTDHDYGKVTDNQLRTLSHIGLFAEPPKTDVVALPDPYDESIDINARARSYLHINCAHCHRRGGGGTAPFELLHNLSLEKTLAVGARPTQGTFDIHAAEVIAPGDPFRSVMFYRVSTAGIGRMPHIGSTVVDDRGVRLIHDWIAQLPPSSSKTQARATTAKLRADQTAALRQLPTGAGLDAAIDQLLSTTSGSVQLLWMLSRRSPASAVRDAVLAKAAKHPQDHIRGLFERFLPEDQRTKRLGNVIKPQAILSLTGDRTRGSELFFKTAGIQCRNCHRINQTGKELGPDLDGVGKKYDRGQLLETILQPSKKIDPKYVSYLVETAQGRVFTGLLVKKDAAEVVLKTNEAKELRIPAGDVELILPQSKSLMPELILKDLTAQQVADLLEFLSSLKSDAK